MNWTALWSQIWDLLLYKENQPLLFTQGQFLFFFTVFFFGFLFVYRHIQARIIYLTLFSFYFYYKSSGAYVSLLLASAVFNYALAFLLVPKEAAQKGRGWILALGIVLNLIPLFYFKYTNFFRLNLHWLWGEGEFKAWSIFLPVGISFFTFQAISYLVDVYKGSIGICSKPLDFAFYLSFFPQLVAGPIVRAVDFLPQIWQNTRYVNELSEGGAAHGEISRQDLGMAFFLILKGFIKKAIVADYISLYGDLIFDNPTGFSGFENLMGMYAYTLQIYCDFSGYSDMAIGLALLMGYRLPDNFNSPYQSLSITEFWRRWHISLSSWLRDYIYIALGGNQKGIKKQYLFLMITMLVGGWWHGASWKFIFWGAMHGLALAMHKYWLSLRKQYPEFFVFKHILGNHILGKFIAWFLTFHFVAILWLFFRASDFATAWTVLTQIFSNLDFAYAAPFYAVRPLVVWLLILGMWLHFQPSRDKLAAAHYFGSLPVWAKAAVFLVFIQLALQLQSEDVQPFIYFQF